jgi:hypothetical protein
MMTIEMTTIDPTIYHELTLDPPIVVLTFIDQLTQLIGLRETILVRTADGTPLEVALRNGSAHPTIGLLVSLEIGSTRLDARLVLLSASVDACGAATYTCSLRALDAAFNMAPERDARLDLITYGQGIASLRLSFNLSIAAS